MGNSKETKVVDHDYSLMPVPKFARRRFLTMFMIMLGFTFFSASMWTGQQLGDSMDLPGFIGALALGGAILAVYTGALAYVGAKTGLSLDLLAQHSFGAKGSYLPSVLISYPDRLVWRRRGDVCDPRREADRSGKPVASLCARADRGRVHDGIGVFRD